MVANGSRRRLCVNARRSGSAGLRGARTGRGPDLGGSSGTEFRVLGPFEVLVDGGAVALGGVKPRLVLTALVLHANKVVPTDRLIDIVWGDDPPASAVGTLRKYVFRLRQAIEPRAAANSDSMLRTCAPGYILDVDPQHVDASRFERLVTDARLGAARGDLARAATALDAALGLWRGPAWAEFADEEFARTEVARLDELHAVALEARAEIGLAAGRHAELIGDLEATAAQHSLRERPHAQLMVALYRSGRQTDAFRVYQAFRRHVADEVGLEPSPALRDLEARMIRQETTLDWDAAILAADQRSQQVPLPNGVVTFLLTDIESSTRLWDEWPEEMAKALARQEGVINEVVALHAGYLLKWRGEGDSTLSVFAKATDACAAAVELQRRLGSEVWPGVLTLRTRVALHSGEAQLRDGDYYGAVLNRRRAHSRARGRRGDPALPYHARPDRRRTSRRSEPDRRGRTGDARSQAT